MSETDASAGSAVKNDAKLQAAALQGGAAESLCRCAAKSMTSIAIDEALASKCVYALSSLARGNLEAQSRLSDCGAASSLTSIVAHPAAPLALRLRLVSFLADIVSHDSARCEAGNAGGGVLG